MHRLLLSRPTSSSLPFTATRLAAHFHDMQSAMAVMLVVVLLVVIIIITTIITLTTVHWVIVNDVLLIVLSCNNITV